MKKRQSIFKGVVGIIVLASMLMAFTSSFDVDKSITKSFNVSPSSSLNLDNEYGDIKIDTWDQNVVEITVEIRAQSGIKSYANKFIKGTTIDFNQKDNKVFARTKLGPRKANSKWLSWFTGNQTYEVNYFVLIPELTNLNIENEYGDITLEQYDGDLEIDLSYGDLRSEIITGTTNIKVIHGEAVLKGMSNGTIELNFSEFKTQKAGNLELNTTDSELEIKEALNLTVFSKYDHFNIGSMDNLINEGAYDVFDIIKARSININTRYTDLSVDLCEVDFKIEMTKGEAMIKHISSAFDGGSIEGNNTEFEFTFEGNVNIDVSTEHTDVDLSNELVSNSDQRDKNKRQITAFKGDQTSAKTLKGKMKYGSLKIK